MRRFLAALLLMGLVFSAAVSQAEDFLLGVEPEFCVAANAHQFKDYSRYEADLFSEEDKVRYRDEVFPQECRNAFDMVVRLALKAQGLK